MLSVQNLVVAGLSVTALSLPAAAQAKLAAVYTGVFSNVAVSGYDPVAYFTERKPMKGEVRYSTSYGGAEWRFATAANLARFKANPSAYAPQYGGYCAWAVGQGYTASGDPRVWRIVNNKLYLNYNQEVGRKWALNIPGFVRDGDRNWPRLLAK